MTHRKKGDDNMSLKRSQRDNDTDMIRNIEITAGAFEEMLLEQNAEHMLDTFTANGEGCLAELKRRTTEILSRCDDNEQADLKTRIMICEGIIARFKKFNPLFKKTQHGAKIRLALGNLFGTDMAIFDSVLKATNLTLDLNLPRSEPELPTAA
ncbi:MAG: hypothetical protein WCW14_02765 [Candidatus Paceibacterota bacterium]|jgi:hypothetical protein